MNFQETNKGKNIEKKEGFLRFRPHFDVGDYELSVGIIPF